MKKILVVDDQAEVRELIDVTLGASGYLILTAGSGQEALDIARKERPDLIIMDVMMPGDIDGLDATRILKNDKMTDGVIIIMLTAKGQEADIVNGIQSGADGYFIKPFSPLELIRKVDEVLSE